MTEYEEVREWLRRQNVSFREEANALEGWRQISFPTMGGFAFRFDHGTEEFRAVIGPNLIKTSP
jgi:hypothetical protein